MAQRERIELADELAQKLARKLALGERMEGSNLTGKILAGRYKLIKLIGQGGMGSVYQGHDQQMSNRVVAIKILAPHLVSDEKQVARFEQEARAANQLRHPNTISVIDFGQSDGHIYMVMEFLTGEPLTHVMRRGRMETARALYMIRQVLKSLAEAHAKGIIHRDLKPDNIFVCDIYGEKDFVKVIDFGIAKFLEAGGAELTQAGKMFGTPRYLSPEQAQGLPLSAASDLYSLGVILFEMLSGRPPFVAEDPIAVAIKHVQEQPPSFAEVAPDLYVPDELDHMVFKLLSKKAVQRFQSSEEVLEAIDQVLGALSMQRHPSGQFNQVGNRTPGRPMTVPPPSRRSQPPPSKQDDDADATRTLDTLQAEQGGEPARTMALDTSSAGPVGASATANAATMALDMADARSRVESMAADKRANQKAETKATAAAHTGPSMRNLVLLLIVAVLVVGAVVVTVFGGKDESKALPPAPATAERADPSGGEPSKASKAEAPEPSKAEPSKAEPSKAEPPKAEEPKAAAEAPKAEPPAAAPAGADAGAAPSNPTVAAAAPEVRKMTLESTPAGAVVLVDGKEVGKTPAQLELKKGGGQKVLVKKDGFDDFPVEFEVLYTLAPIKPVYSVALTASKSVINKVAPKKKKVEW